MWRNGEFYDQRAGALRRQGDDHPGRRRKGGHPHPAPVLPQGPERDRRLPDVHGGDRGHGAPGPGLQHPDLRGHGHPDELPPGPGGPEDEPAAHPLPARFQLHRLRPQRVLRAPAPVP